MKRKVEIIFLPEALKFKEKLDLKANIKLQSILMRIAEKNDVKFFKKLTSDIWELRMRYKGQQYRFFAFWDLRNERKALILLTHGIVKKTQKIPIKEIKRAIAIRNQYFKENKS